MISRLLLSSEKSDNISKKADRLIIANVKAISTYGTSQLPFI